MKLRDYKAGAALPKGAARLAIEVDGTESDAQIKSLKDIDTVVVILNIAEGVSRVHAARRVFEVIKTNDITLPVIHHMRFQVRPATPITK